MYFTTDEMADLLLSPIRRIRIELGDPTLSRQTDDAWLNNEIRWLTWRLEGRRRQRRPRSR